MLGKPFRQGNLPVSHHRRVLQNIFDQARFRYIAGCFQMQNNTLYHLAAKRYFHQPTGIQRPDQLFRNTVIKMIQHTGYIYGNLSKTKQSCLSFFIRRLKLRRNHNRRQSYHRR